MKKIGHADNQNRSIKKSLDFLYGYFLPYWKQFIGLFILIFSINLLSLATPYFLKIIIDEALPKKNFSLLSKILLSLVFIYFLRVTFSFIFDTFYTKVSQTIICNIRLNLLSTILKQHISFFQEKLVGDINYILLNDVNNVQFFLSFFINDLLNNVLLILIILGFMFSMNSVLALISILSVPLIVILILKTTPAIHRKFKKVQSEDNKLFNFFLEIIKNIKLIKILNTMPYELRRVSTKQNEIIKLQVANSRLYSLTNNLITFVMASIPLVILYFGGSKVISGILTIGELIAFIQYLNRLLPPVSSLTNGYSTIIKSFVSVQRIRDFIAENNNVKTTQYLNTHAVDLEIVSKVELVNVCLNHSSKVILRNISFTFYEGFTYLIKGDSGVGKSSLLSLLSGIIYPSTGRILVNNIDYGKVGNMSRNICLVEKENQIFSDTITNNINYGSFESEESEILNSLKKVGLLDRILEFNDNIHSQINSNNTSLSDGQRQRLILARIFVNRYSLIMLDEATASLDIETERQLIKEIRSSFKHAIIIIISHRFSFNDLCDEILELKEGKLIYVKKRKNEDNPELLV